MIPPSALGVLLASLAQISVGDFLLSIIFPGLLMAVLFALYIIVRVPSESGSSSPVHGGDGPLSGESWF